MGKSEIIELANRFYTQNQVTSLEALNLIEEYCKLKEKPLDEISLFIEALSQVPLLLNEYFIYTLQYYLRECNAFILRDKNNQIIYIYQ